MSSTRSPLDVEDVRRRVNDQLGAFLDFQVAALERISGDLGPLSHAAGDLLAGGKRLRPAFCYWGWRGAGGDDSEAAIRAATSLELLQGCALVHDDVMDGSDTRRGLPAAHRRFEALHSEQDWRGSAPAFGVGAAILLGDLCLSWADEMLLTSGLPPDRLQAGKAVFDEMRSELMAGQYLDLLEQARGGGSVERALTVVQYKSAKYTVERPLELGGVLTDAEEPLLAAYRDYGLRLGEAFQLRDDVLGVFGDPDITGKPAGDDLREGKRTVLVAQALAGATPSQAHELESHLGDLELDSQGVARLREIIIDTGALASVERLITELADAAESALAAVSLQEPAGTVLQDLIIVATARKG